MVAHLRQRRSGRLHQRSSKLVLSSRLLGGYRNIQRLEHEGQGDDAGRGLVCGRDGDDADDLPGRVRGHNAGRPD
jgi:hypothetical protein